MLLSTHNTDFFSGYIKLNESLLISEFSGNINEILRCENLSLNVDFNQIVEALKKNLRLFFIHEVLPAIKSKTVKHVAFDRKNSKLTVAITPIGSGFTILSFDEIGIDTNPGPDFWTENLSEVSHSVNADFLIDYVSKNCNAKFGKKASDLLGRTIEEIVLFDENTPLIMEIIRGVFNLQKHRESDFLLRNGEKLNWWNLHFIPDNYSSDNQNSVLIILKNVNRYKQIEEKLFESEQRYQMATEAADLGIWDYIVGTGTTFFSRRWKSMLGYYPDEIDDELSVWENMLHQEDKDRVMHYMSSFIESD